MSSLYRQNLKVHEALADIPPDHRWAEIVAAVMELDPKALHTAECLLDIVVAMTWKLSRKDREVIINNLRGAADVLQRGLN